MTEQPGEGKLLRMPTTRTTRTFDSLALIADLGEEGLTVLGANGVQELIDFLAELEQSSPDKLSPGRVEIEKVKLRITPRSARQLVDLFEGKTKSDWERSPARYQAIIELLLSREFTHA